MSPYNISWSPLDTCGKTRGIQKHVWAALLSWLELQEICIQLESGWINRSMNNMKLLTLFITLNSLE